MCIRDRAKTEHNLSEQNTYTDQSVIQKEDEFPATDDKIDNGEKEETKLVDVYKRQRLKDVV